MLLTTEAEVTGTTVLAKFQFYPNVVSFILLSLVTLASEQVRTNLLWLVQLMQIKDNWALLINVDKLQVIFRFLW